MNNSSRFDPFVGQPVRSIQTALRKISRVYEDIPPVIPDGQFGEQTETAVRAFQRKFGLPENGRVDNETWDKIRLVHDDVGRYMDEPDPAVIYPGPQFTILPGEGSVHLFVIQAMLLALSLRFANLPVVRVTGIHDGPSVSAVRKLQSIFGMTENGMIEKEFWNRLASVYKGFTAKDVFGKSSPRRRV
ncbi:peptidoglycan-binding domain-containing protein [Bacilliculturomica massiliensis]|uniref:peptidoglycan-binding domain-containing protein n=1 Tax=Bacilliculturomica massiliensis TaxID=1917867 RepID=UPI0010303366|nr:peptidoglycan-binding protein [Bacilliculturomica massiliensis]